MALIGAATERDAALAALVTPETEQALLGALLSKAELIEALPAALAPEHFGVQTHPDIYAAIRAAATAQPKGPLLLSVAQVFAADEDMKKYITSLISATVGLLPDSVATYGRMVLDYARRRQIVEITERLRVDAAIKEHATPADALVARAMAELDRVAAAEIGGRRAVSLDEAIDEAMAAAEEATRRQGPCGISTGMVSVDDVLGGMEPGTLHVLGGRPGSGKSSLGWQWALNVARAKHGVLAISLEMSAAELGRRALAVASGVPIWRMRKGQLDQHHMNDLVVARKELRGLPLRIEDGGGLTAAQIALKARHASRKVPLGLIMIDHLHIVRPEDGDVRAGATWAVGRISGAMKRLAKEHSCPVLLLAQLNRMADGRDDHRPVMADLRQSGDIEQDADTVSFVYREEYYVSKAQPERREGEGEEAYSKRITAWEDRKERAAGRAELIVAKVRDGATGVIPLRFDGELTRFGEMEAAT